MNLFRHDAALRSGMHNLGRKHDRIKRHIAINNWNLFCLFVREDFFEPTDDSHHRTKRTDDAHEWMRHDACEQQRAAECCDEWKLCGPWNRS